MSFKKMIWNNYLEFQRKAEKSGFTAYANYLTEHNRYGIKFSQQIVSGWLNGEFKASEKYALALADIMGEEIFDVLDIPHPDYDLQAITRVWDRIPETSRRAIREQAEALVEGKEKKKNKHDRQTSESTI